MNEDSETCTCGVSWSEHSSDLTIAEAFDPARALVGAP